MTNAAPPARAPSTAAPAPAHRADPRGGAVFDQAFFALLVDAGEESVDGIAAFTAGLSPLPPEERPAAEQPPLAEVATAEAFPPMELVAPMMAQILASSAAPVPVTSTAPGAPPELAAAAAPGPALPEAGAAEATGFEVREFPGAPRAAERSQAAPFGLGAESAWPRSDGAWPGEGRGDDKAVPAGHRGDPAASGVTAAPAAPTAVDPVRTPVESPVAPAAALGAAEAAAARTPPAPPSLAPIAVPPASPAWKEAFAERVTLVTRSGVEEAEIVIRPAELGPVEVRVRIQDGEALLSFDAPHPETREAIELALPRLREMLAESGLAMRDAQVGSGDAGRDDERAAAGRESPKAGTAADETPAEPVRRRAVPAPGRVDTFV